MSDGVTEPAGRVVMYVDDDAANRHLMTRVFTSKRPAHRLLVATTAAEALEEANANAIDLILLDLNLPDMSGSEVLQIVKKRYAMPVVILSGHSDPETRERLIAAGADSYVTKPFDVAELLALIDRLLA